MDLAEIERQMGICKIDIAACNAAISTLNEGIPLLDNSKLNLQNSIIDLDNGYKCEACKINTDKVEQYKADCTLQSTDITSIITGLQANITFFNQRLAELEIEKAAEMVRIQAAAESLKTLESFNVLLTN